MWYENNDNKEAAERAIKNTAAESSYLVFVVKFFKVRHFRKIQFIMSVYKATHTFRFVV